jgi:hypothetical protein
VGEAPVFFAPSLGYYVVAGYADIERVFLDPATDSAANAPEVGKTLLDGGHRPQPSMVSLDPPEHGRLRKPAARAFTPRGERDGAAHPRRDDDFCSALLEIHDEDPDALAHEDIASILLRRARDDQQPDRQRRAPAARGARALGAARGRAGADRRRRGRDPALRPVGAGLAARDHPAGHARRRRPSGGGEAVPLARGRRPRRVRA